MIFAGQTQAMRAAKLERRHQQSSQGANQALGRVSVVVTSRRLASELEAPIADYLGASGPEELGRATSGVNALEPGKFRGGSVESAFVVLAMQNKLARQSSIVIILPFVDGPTWIGLGRLFLGGRRATAAWQARGDTAGDCTRPARCEPRRRRTPLICLSGRPLPARPAAPEAASQTTGLPVSSALSFVN